VTVGADLLTPPTSPPDGLRDHRKRDYRSMELELSTMVPYLALLPPEYGQAIKDGIGVCSLLWRGRPERGTTRHRLAT
jgi:hypothetical protein